MMIKWIMNRYFRERDVLNAKIERGAHIITLPQVKLLVLNKEQKSNQKRCHKLITKLINVILEQKIRKFN